MKKISTFAVPTKKGKRYRRMSEANKKIETMEWGKCSRNIKTCLTEDKPLQHIKGRREVSAKKFIKEMSFTNVAGLNRYKFKVHEPRKFFKSILTDK